MTVDANQIIASLPGAMRCDVTYNGASHGPAVKVSRTGEWVTEVYGVATNYSFSIYTTAQLAELADFVGGRRITVDGEEYGIMGVMKGSMNSYWRIDVESLHA